MARQHQQTSAELADALPAYILSDEVADVAGQVIADNDAFRSLDEVRIGYALRTDQPISDDDEVDNIVGTAKASALWACLSDYDVVIWVKQPYWKLYDEVVRRAIVTHGLCHVFVSEEGKVKRLGHDVEEFTRVAVQFGPWSAKLLQFQRGLATDRKAKPEQTAIAQDPPPAVDAGKVVELGNRARDARKGSDQPPVVHP
jgi:hypothetical protein